MSELWRKTPQGLQRRWRDVQRIRLLPQRFSRDDEDFGCAIEVLGVVRLVDASGFFAGEE
jgi:hypothetical protein